VGRRSTTGGVSAKGDRIQFRITYQGKVYRPTIDKPPTEANLRAARKQHEAIMRRIRNGTFNFAEEFPDYKFLAQVAPAAEIPTFRKVALDWLKSVRGELDFATFESYRKILGFNTWEIEGKPEPGHKRRRVRGFWLPAIGEKPIPDIKYSDLTNALSDHPFGSRKTRNNVVSVVRLVFDYAIADKIIRESPAARLKTLKVQKQPPDPYTVEEAEQVIAGIREDWGQDDADYFEFAFFTGLRPSEQIALDWPSCDLQKGVVRVDKARVMGRDKDTTKTSVVRDVELCPRALAVLQRRLARTSLKGANVFGLESGAPYPDLQKQWKRWQFTHKRLKLRYREPYQTRHSSVTWNLMIGKNLLWVAEQHGHSPGVMLKTYAKWLKGATEADIEAIKRAMGYGGGLQEAQQRP
jgi:integrase